MNRLFWVATGMLLIGCGDGEATGPGTDPIIEDPSEGGVQRPDGGGPEPGKDGGNNGGNADLAGGADVGVAVDLGEDPDQGATLPPDQGTTLLPDQGTTLPVICNELLANGSVKNPGCDPGVEANGFDAIDSVTIDGKTAWLMISGWSYWSYDQTNNRFDGGGAIAALLREVAPDCTAKTADGIALNPGCDAQVQTGGIDAIGSATTAEGTTWLITRGRKFWVYDGAHDAFTAGGSDIATHLRSLPPDCAAKTADNIALNPGCDADVQARGITTVDATTDAEGKVSWLMLSGRKYWTLDLSSGEFTGGGRSIADFMVTLTPDCGTTSDGLVRNPGCDATVKVHGLAGLSSVTIEGKASWVLLSGNRYWTYGEQEGGTVGFGGGKDFAGFLRELPVAP